MIKFEEPKVEFLSIKVDQVVYASPTGGAGGVTTCQQSGGPKDCPDGITMFD